MKKICKEIETAAKALLEGTPFEEQGDYDWRINSATFNPWRLQFIKQKNIK